MKIKNLSENARNIKKTLDFQPQLYHTGRQHIYSLSTGSREHLYGQAQTSLVGLLVSVRQTSKAWEATPVRETEKQTNRGRKKRSSWGLVVD